VESRHGAVLRRHEASARRLRTLAARILSDMRDSFEVDHEHVLATELNMSLDERFRPTRVADAIAGTCLDSKDEPVVVGTLDALYSFPEEGMMRIHFCSVCDLF
jgi:hypothetical protein